MSTHCAFCRQPFEPGEGKLQDQAGAFHPRCFAVHSKVAESRQCGCCNLAIHPTDECVGSFDDGPTLRYHKACFAAVGAAHPKPEAEPDSVEDMNDMHYAMAGAWRFAVNHMLKRTPLGTPLAEAIHPKPSEAKPAPLSKGAIHEMLRQADVFDGGYSATVCDQPLRANKPLPVPCTECGDRVMQGQPFCAGEGFVRHAKCNARVRLAEHEAREAKPAPAQPEAKASPKGSGFEPESESGGLDVPLAMVDGYITQMHLTKSLEEDSPPAHLILSFISASQAKQKRVRKVVKAAAVIAVGHGFADFLAESIKEAFDTGDVAVKLLQGNPGVGCTVAKSLHGGFNEGRDLHPRFHAYCREKQLPHFGPWDI